MPYSSVSECPKWVQELGTDKAKQWMAVFNSVMGKGGPESKAFAEAAAAVGAHKADDGDELQLFIPITKIDEEKRLLIGTITQERVDKSGEAMDYESSKPFYEKWSSEISQATGGKSVGNLRSMHGSKVAGKLTSLAFNDNAKSIECVAKVLDDNEWRLCLEGAYTGFSQGGRYVKRWKDENGTAKYTVNPAEVSLVDNPCLSTARFELVKADGAVEEREFKNTNTEQPTQNKVEDEPKADVVVKGEPEFDVWADYHRRMGGLREFNAYLGRESS